MAAFIAVIFLSVLTLFKCVFADQIMSQQMGGQSQQMSLPDLSSITRGGTAGNPLQTIVGASPITGQMSKQQEDDLGMQQQAQNVQSVMAQPLPGPVIQAPLEPMVEPVVVAPSPVSGPPVVVVPQHSQVIAVLPPALAAQDDMPANSNPFGSSSQISDSSRGAGLLRSILGGTEVETKVDGTSRVSKGMIASVVEAGIKKII